MRTTLLAALLLAASGCGGGSPLSGDLEATGLQLYLPDVPGYSVSGVEVGEDGGVQARLERTSFSMGLEERAAGGLEEVSDLCHTTLMRGEREGGDTCDSSSDEGIVGATISFEEMTNVYVVRGGTLLVIRGVVNESDPSAVPEALAALRSAPEVSASDLASHD